MERTIKQVEFVATRRIDVLRVAAYARVSTGKDAMLHSLSAQVSYYSNLIQKHPGWLYCGVYADEALTGTKDNRDNFQRLLEACRAGEIDMVITKSISRFARSATPAVKPVQEIGQGKMLLTVREAAETLGLSRATVYTLIHRDDFPSIRIGSKILINTKKLQEWVDNQSVIND